MSVIGIAAAFSLVRVDPGGPPLPQPERDG
jgi:hypothetical protein